MYKSCALTSLAELLEALSGVLCELSANQEGNEPVLVFNQNSSRHGNTLLSVDRFLQKYRAILASEHREAKPYTALYLKAQTLSFEVSKLAKRSQDCAEI